MILSLGLEDFVLAERVDLRFEDGFTVITGETGSGKSMLLRAIALGLGQRGGSETIRHGADRAVIEMELSDAAGQVRVLRREIGPARSLFRLDGHAATQAQVRALCHDLVQVVSQGQAAELEDEALERRWLDALGDLAEQVNEMRKAYLAYAAATERIEGLGADPKERERRMDLLRYQVRELEEAALTEGEEEVLAREARRLSGHDRLVRSLATALQALGADGSGARDRIAASVGELSAAAQIDPEISPVLEAVREAGYGVEEAVRDLTAYLEDHPGEPGRLELVERRREKLYELGRKYGATTGEMIAYLDRARADLCAMEDAHEHMQALVRDRERLLEAALGCAVRLHEARAAAAPSSARRIAVALEGLGFQGGAVEIAVDWATRPGSPFVMDGLPLAVDETGASAVRFLFRPNPGEPARPLGEVASGGELSRLMLALASVNPGQERTLVFDEIDQGLGGEAAERVAERLRELGRTRQVVAVTHEAVIAAAADHHIAVRKLEAAGRTVSVPEPLAREPRVREVARMLAGSRETGTEHARTLLRRFGNG